LLNPGDLHDPTAGAVERGVDLLEVNEVLKIRKHQEERLNAEIEVYHPATRIPITAVRSSRFVVIAAAYAVELLR
jgi:hypothetical protein